jgi:phosphoenolpyruvate carboxylase
LTEQGEILSSRYENQDLARRNLEQIVNAVLVASAPEDIMSGKEIPGHLQVSSKNIPGEWRDAMNRMSAAAMSSYRKLVFETPGFLDYWHSVTPLEEIKFLHIGSRPSARKPGADDVRKIRAIPWVFSWMQSRFNLPGWYGLGSGLQAIMKQDDGTALLRKMYTSWPFFRHLLSNAELSLLKADMGIAALYNNLALDTEPAERIFNAIQQEYERSRRAVLTITGGQALMEKEPEIERAIRMRNPYVDPLNYIQVEMLRRLRTLPENERGKSEQIREVIVLTINGIAAGLRNTG